MSQKSASCKVWRVSWGDGFCLPLWKSEERENQHASDDGPGNEIWYPVIDLLVEETQVFELLEEVVQLQNQQKNGRNVSVGGGGGEGVQVFSSSR